jgi:hypothetical protein
MFYYRTHLVTIRSLAMNLVRCRPARTDILPRITPALPTSPGPRFSSVRTPGKTFSFSSTHFTTSQNNYSSLATLHKDQFLLYGKRRSMALISSSCSCLKISATVHDARPWSIDHVKRLMKPGLINASGTLLGSSAIDANIWVFELIP